MYMKIYICSLTYRYLFFVFKLIFMFALHFDKDYQYKKPVNVNTFSAFFCYSMHGELCLLTIPGRLIFEFCL